MMSKLFQFLAGAMVGVIGTLLIIFIYFPTNRPVSNSDESTASISFESAINTLASTNKDCAPPKSMAIEATPTPHSATEIELAALLRKLNSATENSLSSEAFKDLIYLIKKDKNIAKTLREMLVNSDSYEEKMILVNALAQAGGQENNPLIIDMISSPDETNKQLGFELLSLQNPNDDQAELSATLLNASYQETNPERLATLIYRLSESNPDELTKRLAIERFQSFLSSNESTITAGAINGLALLADQDTILTTAREYLQNANNEIRMSAISSLFKVDHLEADVLASLSKIAQDANEPESTRNIATAVLQQKESDEGI